MSRPTLSPKCSRSSYCRFEGLQNDRSFNIFAGLSPRQQSFYGIFFDKLEGKLSDFRERESRSGKTWFSLRIERFSRVSQSVDLTKPSSLLHLSTVNSKIKAQLKLDEMAKKLLPENKNNIINTM